MCDVGNGIHTRQAAAATALAAEEAATRKAEADARAAERANAAAVKLQVRAAPHHIRNLTRSTSEV